MENHVQNTPPKQKHFKSPLPPRTPSMATPVNSRGQYGKKGACFVCEKEGHWAKDCPSKSRSLNSSKTAPRRITNYPEKMCKCGLTCSVRKSQSKKNPDRDYYSCPKLRDQQCKFFQWCDEAINTGQPDRSSEYPICKCRAGRSRLLTVQDGELAGCQYFVCMLKEGYGACNFFEWDDRPIPVKPNNDTIEQGARSASLVKTIIPASQELPTRRKLDFEEQTSSGYVGIDVKDENEAAFEPSLSFKDCYTLPRLGIPRSPMKWPGLQDALPELDLGQSSMKWPSAHVSLNVD